MASIVRPRFAVCLLTLLAACATTWRATCAEEIRPAPDSIAVSLLHAVPDAPLKKGTGLMIRYRHSFLGKAGAHPAAAPEAPPPARCLNLEGALSGLSHDREAQGLAKEGSASLRMASVSLREAWLLADGRWAFEAGAGLDYITAEGKGDYSTPAPIGISNRYDVDSGVGWHVALLAAGTLSAHWGLQLGLDYQFAELDGEQRFVISGVPGIPLPVKFDLTGPRIDLGLAYRF